MLKTRRKKKRGKRHVEKSHATSSSASSSLPLPTHALDQNPGSSKDFEKQMHEGTKDEESLELKLIISDKEVLDLSPYEGVICRKCGNHADRKNLVLDLQHLVLKFRTEKEKKQFIFPNFETILRRMVASLDQNSTPQNERNEWLFLFSVLGLFEESNIINSVAPESKRTALHYAAENSNLRAVQELCVRGANTFDVKDKDGCRPIDLATDNAVKNYLQEEMRRKAILDDLQKTTIVKDSKKTQTHYQAVTKQKQREAPKKQVILDPSFKAIQAKNLSAFSRSLTDVNKQLADGRSLLIFAVESNFIEAVILLKELKACLTTKDSGGRNVYHCAAQGKVSTSILKILLSEDILSPGNKNILNEADENDIVPLAYAIQDGNHDAIKLFLDAGADPNIVYCHDASLLMFAADKGDLKAVTLLLSAQADVNKTHNHNLTALRISLKKGHYSIMELLLDNGADPNVVYEGITAVSYAFLNAIENNEKKEFRLALALLLKKRGEHAIPPNFNIKIEQSGQPLILIAVVRQNIELMNLLLKAGVDVNSCSNTGNTPLFSALEETNAHMAKLLLKEKSLDISYSYLDTTYLHHAIQYKNPAEILTLLIQRIIKENEKTGKNLMEYRNRHGLTPLELAVCLNDSVAFDVICAHKPLTPKTASELLKVKHDTHIGPVSKKILKALLAAGADPNTHIKITSSTYTTPLQQAIDENSQSKIKMLVEAGATIPEDEEFFVSLSRAGKNLILQYLYIRLYKLSLDFYEEPCAESPEQFQVTFFSTSSESISKDEQLPSEEIKSVNQADVEALATRGLFANKTQEPNAEIQSSHYRDDSIKYETHESPIDKEEAKEKIETSAKNKEEKPAFHIESDVKTGAVDTAKINRNKKLNSHSSKAHADKLKTFPSAEIKIFKSYTYQKAHWAQGRIKHNHVKPIENSHDKKSKYCLYEPKQYFLKQYLKRKQNVEQFWNLERLKFCRKYGDEGISPISLHPRVFIDVYIGDVYYGKCEIRYEMKIPNVKERIYCIQIPADEECEDKTILLMPVIFDPKGLHDGNVIKQDKVIIPQEALPKLEAGNNPLSRNRLGFATKNN